MSSVYTNDHARSLLPLEKLRGPTEAEIAAYRDADPYPHAVFDDFFDEEILDRVLEEFPGSGQGDWQKFDDRNQVKLASKGEEKLGTFTRSLIYHLNSSTFINWLQRLTGISGLIPDPHLHGGGLHQIVPGGKLALHVDFNDHKALRLDRRINVLVYLNRDWREEYGGYFELWNRDMTASVKKILPLFNRMVVFSTTEISWHGHPDPLTCPEDRTRKSLALYYYSNGRPEEAGMPKRFLVDDHSTMWATRPGETKGKLANTVSTLSQLLLPPIVLKAKRALLKK